MTISTNASGVAVCRCGHELVVACTGGCEDPELVFEHEDRAPAVCNWPGCDQPVAERAAKQTGPEPKKCEKHKAMQRAYRDRFLAKKAATS